MARQNVTSPWKTPGASSERAAITPVMIAVRNLSTSTASGLPRAALRRKVDLLAAECR
jgi:hypothetical protein